MNFDVFLSNMMIRRKVPKSVLRRVDFDNACGFMRNIGILKRADENEVLKPVEALLFAELIKKSSVYVVVVLHLELFETGAVAKFPQNPHSLSVKKSNYLPQSTYYRSFGSRDEENSRTYM